ncbi:hypothetical protein XBP1_1050020 [Xenorhabdus bovienii str. puntauvense]|uniref:Uncharacterized protein n=1 Tax=Xenorhabdus bovienii str. puntauvense TaxID=1398201 RepID=A0A077N7X8_XENBV|nr:hypothetical protein XBP1_1050020 [Xenorhabdus bovienii str. puntauvense]
MVSHFKQQENAALKKRWKRHQIELTHTRLYNIFSILK